MADSIQSQPLFQLMIYGGYVLRKRIYEIIESGKENDIPSNIYSVFMMFTIACSLIPLMFKSTNIVFFVMDKFAAGVFVIEYILRLVTADYRLEKGKLSFFIYPFTPLAICDVLVILPSLSLINGSFRLLKVFRLLQTFRVFRAFKMVRYSRSKRILLGAYKRQRKPLLLVIFIAFAYILIAALTLFNVEPDLFNNFFDAIYWATISLTTVGYGDITPVTPIGRSVAVISSIFGIAIIALPSGIITAGLMRELGKVDKDDEIEMESLNDIPEETLCDDK